MEDIFDFDSVRNFILEYIGKGETQRLKQLLEKKKIKHFLKPAVTDVSTLKLAIGTGDEDITIVLLKALFDLNLNLEDETFTIVLGKTIDYIKENGFINALEYVISRYTPLHDEDVKRNLRRGTMENSKKMLKIKPHIEKYKMKVVETTEEEEVKRLIEAEKVFKEKQSYRGVVEPTNWGTSKRNWEHSIPEVRKKNPTKTGATLTDYANSLIRLKKKSYNKRAMDDAVYNLKEHLKKKLGIVTNSKNESDLVDEILDYKAKGYKLGDPQVSTKLKDLKNYYSDHKEFKKNFSTTTQSPFPEGYFRNTSNTKSKFDSICNTVVEKIYNKKK